MYLLAFTGPGLSVAVYLLAGLLMVASGAVSVLFSRRKSRSKNTARKG